MNQQIKIGSLLIVVNSLEFELNIVQSVYILFRYATWRSNFKKASND